MGLATGFKGHLSRWRRAVQMQDERIRAHPWQTELADRSVDTELCALCLRNLLRACWACASYFDRPGHTPFQDAIDVFEVAVPHTRVMRDLLQHFDRYDKDGNLDVFITHDEPPEWQLTPEGYSLWVNELRLDLSAAVRESDVLAGSSLRAINHTLYCLRILGELPG